MNNECPLCGAIVVGDSCSCEKGTPEDGFWLVLYYAALLRDGSIAPTYIGFICKDMETATKRSRSTGDPSGYPVFFAPNNVLSAKVKDQLIAMGWNYNIRKLNCWRLEDSDWRQFISLKEYNNE